MSLLSHSFAADYLEIIKIIKESSLVLDYDEENETVRLKEGAKLVRVLLCAESVCLTIGDTVCDTTFLY